jgi:broad specificity phosphatase PhoE
MAMPTKIMVIRHAEKPDNKHDGVTSHGQSDKESLIVRGWQRAGGLAVLFDPANGPLQNASLAVPKMIYTADPEAASTTADDDGKVGSKSKRPLQTITPLAERLGIKDKVNVSFKKGQEKQMVESVLAASGVVLISWQHEKIPEIAKHIVASKPPTKPIPGKWPGDRFDIVWVFTPPAAPSDRWSFVQVPQQLLSGDANTVIA